MSYKDFVKTDEQIKADLVNKVKTEILDAKVAITYYQTEAAKPTKMGKGEAQENVGLYQEHMKYLETKLKQYEEVDV